MAWWGGDGGGGGRGGGGGGRDGGGVGGAGELGCGGLRSPKLHCRGARKAPHGTSRAARNLLANGTNRFRGQVYQARQATTSPAGWMAQKKSKLSISH